MTRRAWLIALLAFLPAHGQVKPAAVLGDHMVLQRGLPVRVWGTAAAGESVTVSFRGATQTTAADDLGRWNVAMPPGEAGGPFDLTVQGSNRIVLRDVLVGDVWIASGQSNMELPLERAANATAEIAAAKHPKLRLFHVKNKSHAYPLDDVAAWDPWTECTPEAAAKFSAVAYFFGRHLLEKTNVPIGLISTSWGGTPAEAWTSLRSLSSDAALMPVFREWSRMTDDQATVLLRREKRMEQWRTEVEKAKSDGKPAPAYPWAPNLENSWAPAGLFNAMIAPITRFGIKGAIWYQGESNAGADRAPLYARLFETMIRDWREAWGVGNFPFLFVQLANYKTGGMWPELREAQRQTLSLANTAMAVTIDIGEPGDIHPRNKQDVGLRLALAARALAYGEKIEWSGPLFRQAVREGKGLRVYFDHASGLMTKGGALEGFEIAGADRKFTIADAHIEGESVVVSSATVPSPVFVRYGWADNPRVSLYNAAGLPASPFRSAQ